MAHLVLELRPGEMMIVNGAPIRFRTRSRIEFTAHARFLFGKQLMSAEEADRSPARRLYFALQRAYVGTEAERRDGLDSARTMATGLKAGPGPIADHDMLDRAMAAAEADDCYAALKLARQMIRNEDAAGSSVASMD